MDPSDESDDASGDLPVPVVCLGGGVVLAAFLTEAAAEGWAALHVERTLGGDAEAGALGPALFAIMMGIGRLFGHALVRRVPELQMIGMACFVAATGLVMAGVAPVVWVALLGFALAGLGIAVVVPLALALVGRSAPPLARLAAISRTAALGYAAFFLGPPLMGGLAQIFGLRAAFWGIAAILLGVSLLLVPSLARQVGAAPHRR
jgi:MFS family permease